MTHLSLFTGIGGLDLAAEWAGFETVGQCEWADYPTKVLEKHWPDVPRWRDIRTLTGDSFYERTGKRTVDIVSGGFPCQPFSVAGKRRGSEDDRYLWPEMLRVISELRPRWVVGENVAGIVNMALDTVLSDLEALGYTVQAFVIPACAVDAPHRRDRTAIVANTVRRGCRTVWKPGSMETVCRGWPYNTMQTAESGCNVSNPDRDGSDTRRPEPAGQQRPAWTANGGNDVADAQSARLQGHDNASSVQAEGRWKRQPFATDRQGNVDYSVRGRCWTPEREICAGRDGLEYAGRWSAEPDVGRVANGVPSRVDRLKCLGNAVVPQQFYPIFKAIAEIEAGPAYPETMTERREDT